MDSSAIANGVTSNASNVAFFGILLWIAKKYMKKLDDHVAKCDKRAVNNATTMQWIGDGLHAVAQQTGAKLSPRPLFKNEEEAQ